MSKQSAAALTKTLVPAPGTEMDASAVNDWTGCLEQGTFPFWIVSMTGIAVKDECPEHEWRRMTQNVAMMFEATGRKHAQAAMMMGDLLRWGEEKFGEEYADVIDSSREFIRVSMSTLQNWQWIAGKIEPSRRRENLSLSHHEAVAKLKPEEQDEYLRIADNEGMSVNDLKKRIRTDHPGKPRSEKPAVKVKIDIDDPAAVKDAAGIIALWVENRHGNQDEDENVEALKPEMERLYKAYRRRWMNGHSKKKE